MKQMRLPILRIQDLAIAKWVTLRNTARGFALPTMLEARPKLASSALQQWIIITRISQHSG